jgi:hypothetical protein
MFQLYHGEKKLYFDERMMMMMGGSMSQVVGLPINSYKSYHQYGVGSRLSNVHPRTVVSLS